MFFEAKLLEPQPIENQPLYAKKGLNPDWNCEPQDLGIMLSKPPGIYHYNLDICMIHSTSGLRKGDLPPKIRSSFYVRILT